MRTSHGLNALTAVLGDFVIKQHGIWNHEQWEELCAQVSKLGVELDGPFQERLGVLLENLKVFYFCMPEAVSVEKAAIKAKTKPKAKAALKAKAKTVAKPKPKAKAASAPNRWANSTPSAANGTANNIKDESTTDNAV